LTGAAITPISTVPLPGGVMVAQVTLTHLVLVRTQAGQPFEARPQYPQRRSLSRLTPLEVPLGLPFTAKVGKNRSMLVHSVFFWGTPELTAADRAAFRAGLETLKKVPTVETVFIGAPAAVPARDVTEKSFTFALTIIFRDVAAHNTYQSHPVHLAFIETCKKYWTKVAVYDSE
jgi:stress responsive alpha/beta barrel protein